MLQAFFTTCSASSEYLDELGVYNSVPTGALLRAVSIASSLPTFTRAETSGRSSDTFSVSLWFALKPVDRSMGPRLASPMKLDLKSEIESTRRARLHCLCSVHTASPAAAHLYSRQRAGRPQRGGRCACNSSKVATRHPCPLGVRPRRRPKQVVCWLSAEVGQAEPPAS